MVKKLTSSVPTLMGNHAKELKSEFSLILFVMQILVEKDDKWPRTCINSRMASSGMLCRVALVITDVSEEIDASFIRVTRIVN
jgi:hypothetical protein